ncbi:DUF2264 domain-containing protein [Treponema sp.]|uniref:DUF2264 domain-containing protein n=1 Tax=Treponema sp. TaxID=166 RepID=UPI0025E8F64B|nr:DUF2264 domain-containing protein [Treponema sp.]MCR5218691.1 DUF2264 domain-containing protein [Treponema sp.]
MEEGKTRQYWLKTMLKISEPVIKNYAQNKLLKSIPLEFHPDRKDYILLEAIGRTLCGIAPWLENKKVPEEEKEVQAKWRELCRKAIANATDPASPDYANFTQGYGQALVDAAFLAQAILRAPTELYKKLNDVEKENLVTALKATRKFKPFVCNWIFFTAIIEACLYVITGQCDMVRIEYAIRMFEGWYKGDGLYSDGQYFHADYYNSFVIAPMYYDILKVFKKENDYKELFEKIKARASRHAGILEQLINSDGSYPVVGRSTSYRFGVFHALSQAALEGFLPKGVSPAQVRCGLTEVIKKVFSAKNLFDKKGFLTPGIYGRQEKMAEGYISVGSLYLCQTIYLVMGLAADSKFWTDKNQDWTAKKIWSGQDVSCDHAID